MATFEASFNPDETIYDQAAQYRNVFGGEVTDY
jgi:hypothetical protein